MSRSSNPKAGWLAHYSRLIGAWAKGNTQPYEAEDAVQDVAERMLGMDTLAIRDPGAYLHRSATNGMSQHYRRAQALPSTPLHELPETEHPYIDDVESAAYVGQLSAALTTALAELPLAYQQVFAWHRVEQWSVPEIAQHMGLSVSTVEKYLTKTMRHLQQKLTTFTS